MRRLILLAAMLAFAGGAALAAPLVKLTDYVVDGAGVLPPAARTALVEKLRAHELATSNQVAVAIVRTLEGQAIEEAALEILRSTGLGQENRNNGVLLLIAIAERRIRIEVGYGLEGALPDALAGQIIGQEIGPRFKEGDISGGVEAGVDGILAAIAGEYTAQPTDDAPSWIPFAMLAAWVLMVFFIMRRKRRRRARRGSLGGALGGGILGSTIGHRDSWSGGGFGGGSSGGGFGGGGGGGGGGGASGGW